MTTPGNVKRLDVADHASLAVATGIETFNKIEDLAFERLCNTKGLSK